MIVQPIQLAALDWAAAAAGTLAQPWKVGSIVSGRVLEQALNARMVLQINGLTVETEPPSGGLVPRQFQARVVAGGLQPVLELLVPAPVKSQPAVAALRARLPQQGGLQPLLADLQALARTPGARTLPEPVRMALARLEASIADRHDVLDPAVLRDTLKRGGTQLEHTLLQFANAPQRLPATPIDYDLKAALQRLTQALQQLPRTGMPPAASPPAAAGPAPQPATTASAFAQALASTMAPPSSASPPAMAGPPLPLPTTASALAQALTATMPSPPPRLMAAVAAADIPLPLSTMAAATSPATASVAATGDTPPPLLQLPLQPQARLPAPLALDALTLASGMLKHAEAALSRIEIMQLEAHPTASPQAWMVEIPVRDDDGFDVLQLRFEQESSNGQADATPQWTLGFTLEPPGLGAIHGQIRLHGAQVNVDLWAEHAGAVQALEEQTSVLSQLLEGSGLELVQLRVRQGTPLRHTGMARSLLEARA